MDCHNQNVLTLPEESCLARGAITNPRTHASCSQGASVLPVEYSVLVALVLKVSLASTHLYVLILIIGNWLFKVNIVKLSSKVAGARLTKRITILCSSNRQQQYSMELTVRITLAQKTLVERLLLRCYPSIKQITKCTKVKILILH